MVVGISCLLLVRSWSHLCYKSVAIFLRGKLKVLVKMSRYLINLGSNGIYHFVYCPIAFNFLDLFWEKCRFAFIMQLVTFVL